MNTKFRGEAIYTAEVDAHFPQLSVGDTLYFAALARAPRKIPGGVSRTQYAEHLRDVSRFNLSMAHVNSLGNHGNVRCEPHSKHESWERFRAWSQWR